MSDNLTYVFPGNNYVDVTLYQYGREQCAPMLSCGPAVHHHYLLHYIVQGCGSFTVGDDRHYILRAGQAFLICPGAVTSYCADRFTPWTYLWIEFDGLKVPSFLEDAGLSLKHPIYTPSTSEGSAQLEQYMRAMLSDHGAPLRLLGNLYWIFETLARTSRNRRIQKSANLQEFYVHEAMMYVERNYRQNITVADLADWCGLHRSYFGKIFKDTILMTPQEYLIRYRMNLACDLLKNTALSIASVALEVGYENQLHFSRAFKKAIGVAPREYRKRAACRDRALAAR